MNSVDEQHRGTDQPAHGGWRGLVRAWRYFFLLLAICALVGLFYGEENWRGQRAWQRYQRQLAARGEAISRSSFIPATVPDSENFAMTPLLAPLFQRGFGPQKLNTAALTQLQNLAPRFDAASRILKPPKHARSNSWVTVRTDLARWYGGFLVPTNLAAHSDPVIATNFTTREAATGVLEALSECEPVLQELREASRRRYSRFDLNYDEENPASILLPHLAVLKHCCLVLQLKASAELALGRTEQACDDIHLMLNLADATRTEPILITHLVRFSDYQLAFRPIAEGMGQWSEAQLRALQQRLLSSDFCADMKFALTAERDLLGVGVIQCIRRQPEMLGVLSQPSSAPDGFANLLLKAIPSGWFYQEQVNYCSMFDDFLLPAINPRQRRIDPSFVSTATTGMERLLRHPGPSLLLHHRFFAAVMLPALSRISQKAAFAQTGVDLVATACALERYRLAKGEFPESLGRLSPQFMEKLPHDIINGAPLKYQREQGRFILYSVGWNQIDDGGRYGTYKEGSIEEPFRRQGGDSDILTEGDWVWRPF